MIMHLPFPPSTNHYWSHSLIRGKPRTLISAKGRAYRQEIIWCLRVAKPGRVTGTVSMILDLYPPDARKRDCDNFAKALLDAITHSEQIWDDDSQVIDLRIRMHPKTPKPGTVKITIKEFNYGDE